MSGLMSRITTGSKGSKYSDIKFNVMFVTRELAADYLEFNKKNRPLSKSHVASLAEALRNDEWKMTAEPIKFDEHGNLIDGQHRLHAILVAGVGAWLPIARNVPADSFDAMDRGKIRNAADVLAIQDIKYSTTVAGGLRLYSNLKHRSAADNINIGRMVSSQQIKAIMEENPVVHEWAKIAHSGIQRIMKPSLVVGLGMRFSDKSPELARLFFQRLRDGEGLLKGDPILTLRDRLLINRASISKLPTKTVILLTVKAWNAFRNNKKLSMFRVSDDEKIQEII